MVEVRDLTIRYRRRTAVDGISLSVAPREIVLLAGPNGSGKSTLLRAVATLQRIHAGTITVDGNDLTRSRGRNRARRLIGYLPQNPEFPGSFRVHEYLRYAAWLADVPTREAAAEIERIVAIADLHALASRRLRSLSGGERQRVFVAGASLGRPSLLILDEPTEGVDAVHRVAIRSMVHQLAEGSTVLFSSHIAEDFELTADRVVYLRKGRVAFDGTPEAFRAMGSTDASATDGRIESAILHFELGLGGQES